jgi:TonB family protein
MMMMLKHTLAFSMVLACQVLLGQVYITTQPDFLFDGNELTALLTKHVEDVQALEGIRVPDSVVFQIDVNAEGSLEASKVIHAYSASHSRMLQDFLSTSTFANYKGKMTLAVVYPPLAEIPYRISALTGVPETQVCNDYDSKNETFRLACFRYLNEENTKNIAGPDSAERQGADGWAKATFQIGIDGRVQQVTFNRASFNPTLNDIIVDQASQIRFLDGGYVGKKQVSYALPYMESFMYLETGKEVEYLDEASERYEQKAYYQCAFMMLKAKQLGYKFTKQDVNLLASSYLQEGDSGLAYQWWRTNFKEDELKDMKMVPKRVGDIYEVSLVEYVKEENVSNDAVSFVMVEKKPIYPGCEDLENQEEQFNCFNRGIMQHIGKNFKYPTTARQRGIQGKVYVSFVIEKDGSVGNVEIARGVQPILDIECLRIICTMPKMEPAYQRGKTVRMQYTVPINAKLQ